MLDLISGTFVSKLSDWAINTHISKTTELVGRFRDATAQKSSRLMKII